MTPGKQNYLFLQRSPSRAGAQTSLQRLVLSEALRASSPSLLTAQPGWLTDSLEKHGIPTISHPWPSPRSLNARLGGLRRTSRSLVKRLKAANREPTVIIANDHQECLLAHALSRTLGGVPVIAILRTSSMTQGDFVKYRCGDCDLVFAVGHDLRDRIETWTSKTTPLYQEGFAESEFLTPKTRPSEFPTSIFVAGSEQPHKGFPDFFEALKTFEKNQPQFPGWDCYLTGSTPNSETPHYLSDHAFRSNFHFLGRVNNFIETASPFDLAIHPSRKESFGLAPLELILAGIPTLVSTTGIIEKLEIPDDWQFPPNDPISLASCLENLWLNWPTTCPSIQSVHDQIRSQYHIDNTAKQFLSKANQL